MQPYRSQSGLSGVVAFDLHDDSITIEFQDGTRYLYDHRRPGRDKVEAMKRLARDGRGLATFINRNVRDCFAAKLPSEPTSNKV